MVGYNIENTSNIVLSRSSAATSIKSSRLQDEILNHAWRSNAKFSTSFPYWRMPLWKPLWHLCKLQGLNCRIPEWSRSLRWWCNRLCKPMLIFGSSVDKLANFSTGISHSSITSITKSLRWSAEVCPNIFEVTYRVHTSFNFSLQYRTRKSLLFHLSCRCLIKHYCIAADWRLDISSQFFQHSWTNTMTHCLKYSLILNGKYRSHLHIAWNLQNPILLRSNVTSYLWKVNI